MRYAYTYAPSGPRVLTSVVTTPPAPLGQATTTFDAAGRVSSLTDGKAKKTTNCYDAADRVTKVFYLSAAPDCANGAADIAYTYDKLGNLMSRADNTGTTTFAYDWQSRPTSKSSSSGNSSATYDAVGRVIVYTDAGGTVGYRYDAAGQLVALSEPGGNTSCTASPRVLAPKCTSFAYDANGSRTTTVYPSGQANIAAPDESGRVRSITAARPSGATFLSRSYTYTKANSPTGQDQDVDLRRTTTDQSGAVTTYGYDALNRLCSVYAGTTTSVGCTAPAGATTYAYDPSGNRTATRDAAGAVTSYGYNDANQLCWKANGAQAGSACPAPAGATTYAYDPNGNLTSSSAGFSATVNDARNQTTSITVPGQFPTTFAYADVGQDERTVAGSSSFLNGLLGVGSGAFGAYFTREPNGSLVSMRSGSTSLYYTTDALGSVIALTADNGTYDFAIYTYDAYGNLTSPPPTGMGAVNPWRFAGGYFDKDTGLYKFGARYYDPSLGRWTQRDPSGQDANRYTYVGCDPVNFVDPSGYSLSSRLENAYQTGARLSRIAGTVGAAVGCVTGGLGGAAGGSILEPGGGTVGGAIAGCLAYGTKVGSDAAAVGFVVGYGVGFVRGG